MTAGPFTRHRSDPTVVDELAGQITNYGTQAVSVGADAGRLATRTATVDTFGLFAPIQSAIRPTTSGADALAAASRLGDLALRVWSHAVRAYNRTIDDLNTEWATAKTTDFGVEALTLDQAAMSPAAIDDAVADHTTQVDQARSALMARLTAREHDAEGRLDQVAVHASQLLDHADDPDVQTLATYAANGTGNPASVTNISTDDSDYPDSVMQGNPDAYWSTPEARAAQMREDELDNLDGADIGLDDLGETLAFLFADPRQCIGDDASYGGCGLEVASLLPFTKWLKAAKLAKYAKKTDNATDTPRWEQPKKTYGDADSRGSTGPKEPTHLAEELAMEEVREHPELGKALKKSPLKDTRWPASEGWVKMVRNVNGIEIHYVMNLRTGAVDDFKFKY